MKIIAGKAYKEVEEKDLTTKELIAIIEDLQNRVNILEAEKNTKWNYSFPNENVLQYPSPQTMYNEAVANINPLFPDERHGNN